jgi:hypothetical protein
MQGDSDVARRDDSENRTIRSHPHLPYQTVLMPNTATPTSPPSSNSPLKTALLGATLPLLTSIVLTSAVSLKLGVQQEAQAGQWLRAVAEGRETASRAERIELLEADGPGREAASSVPNAALTDNTVTLRWADGKWYLSAAHRGTRGWQVARQPLDAAYAPVKSLQWLLLLCTLPLAALGGVLGWRLGK